MFFPQEPRLKGGGPNVAPPPPHLAPLSPAASLPPCTPGAERCPGTAPRGWGSHLGARSILPGLGGGGCAPPSHPATHWGTVLPPPRPHSSYLWVLLGSPSNKGLGLPWLRGRDLGPYGGALPCTPPCPHGPGGGQREAERRPFKSIYWCRPRSELLGAPPALAQTSLVGCVAGGPLRKVPRERAGGPPLQPPCVQRRSSPGRGGGGPGVSTI